MNETERLLLALGITYAPYGSKEVQFQSALRRVRRYKRTLEEIERHGEPGAKRLAQGALVR